MFAPPPGVTKKHGRYYLVRQNRWIPLTRIDEGEVALLERYYELTNESPLNMAGILIGYLKEAVPELKPATRPDYRRIIVTRLIPYCGHMPRNSMKPGHVAQYLAERKKAGSPIAANRERAVLSSACAFAMGKGWLEFNPCYGVRRNKEKPSTVYVEHHELVPVLDRAPVSMYHLMSAAFLTGARETELMELKKTEVRKVGIVFFETKTGKERTVEWSPTLRKIIEEACARSTNDYVFTSQKGLKWSEWGLQSALRRLRAGFQFRALRAKASSDAKENILAHDKGMLAVYQRRRTVRPVK